MLIHVSRRGPGVTATSASHYKVGIMATLVSMSDNGVLIQYKYVI